MELFKLLGTIAVDNAEAKKALSETTEAAKDSGNKLSGALSAVGKGAAALGKAVVAGVGAAATGVTALSTAAINSYAYYEQLVGGVDTLFKGASGKVQEYAKNAFQTAGMSANNYMETVTSFSASLLQSLDGDTTAAAEKANMAITDMSDNANKMGTDMSMIQNAYQGFAKQNYTMLDNLKLGYGGTQAEMYRLMQDAAALNEEFANTAKFSLSSKGTLTASYADIVDAIHIVQTEMGITGTTAKEASSTISGSLASMKSSWANLLTAISSDDLPFDDYVNSFVDSVATVAENLLPRIETTLGGVVQLVEKLAPVIIAKIPELFSQLLPSIINAATGLLNPIIESLPELIGVLVDSVIPELITGFTTVVNALIEAFPSVVESLVSALPTLIPQLVEGLVSLIVTLCEKLSEIIQPIIDNLPMIITSIVDALMQNLPALIEGAVALVVGLVAAMPQIILGLLEAIPDIMTSIVQGLIDSAPILLKGVLRVAVEVWNSVVDYYTGVKKTIGEWFTSVYENVKDTFEKVKEKMTSPLKSAQETIKSIVDKIKGFFSGMKLEFPKIKMPHFSVTPAGWSIGDLLKGSIPKLGIEWYSKAMQNPMVMNSPTVFGYNSATGRLMGGGEAGSEVVSGTGTLMEMIRAAVASQNETLVYYMQKVIEILASYFPQLLEALDMDIVMNDGVLVGRLAPKMNEELGKISTRKDRGR